MISAGTRARERYFANMRAVEVGARLAHRQFVWTITKQVQRETSVDLTLQRGRRTTLVSVMVCHTGPCLSDAGLRAVASAPVQRELVGSAS